MDREITIDEYQSELRFCFSNHDPEELPERSGVYLATFIVSQYRYEPTACYFADNMRQHWKSLRDSDSTIAKLYNACGTYLVWCECSAERNHEALSINMQNEWGKYFRSHLNVLVMRARAVQSWRDLVIISTYLQSQNFSMWDVAIKTAIFGLIALVGYSFFYFASLATI